MCLTAKTRQSDSMIHDLSHLHDLIIITCDINRQTTNKNSTDTSNFQSINLKSVSNKTVLTTFGCLTY